MIARMWHGTVAASKAGEYRKFLNRRAIPDYGSVEGNKGVFIFERLEGSIAHFMTLTFWKSEEDIAVFAGQDIEVAKYYEEDDGFLLEFEEKVTHYRIVGESWW